MNPVIIYLAQNKQDGSPSGQCSRRVMLEKSLDLLFENYNDKFKHPVLIFHEVDFKPNDQEEIAKGRKEIQFKEIHFEIPSFLKKEDIPERWNNRYSMGYRHMTRFYAVLLYDILNKLGYDWYLRMDDDSYIHSKIDYNLFEFMDKGGYEYGYRVDMREDKCYLIKFGEVILAYLKSEKLPHGFFNQHLKSVSPKIIIKNYIKSALMKFNPNRKYILEPIIEYDGRGYYNNFHITKISFWMEPRVHAFLSYLDRIGGGYKHRWGDACLQSAAIQIFMPEEKVYKFTDWAYEHATFGEDGSLACGGYFEKKGAAYSDRAKEFMRLFGKIHSGDTY